MRESVSRKRIECDVAVIGGGLAGVSAALALAARGLRCVILERAKIGASDGASCSPHVLWRGIVPDLTAFVHEHGAARVAVLDGLAAASRARLDEMLGARATTLLRGTGSRRVIPIDATSFAGATPQRILEIECELLNRLGIPNRVTDNQGGAEVSVADDVVADGRALLAALRERLLEHRIEIVEGALVARIESTVESAVVHAVVDAVQHSFHATRVVLAAGAWSFTLDSWLRECGAIGRAQEVEVERIAVSGAASGAVIALGPFATAIPQAANDRCVLIEGRSPCNLGDPFDAASDPQIVRRLVDSFASRFAISGEFHAARARPRHYTCDGLPLVGPHPQRGSIVFATGFNGLDATFAPLAGEVVAEWLTEGRPRRDDALLWSPRRML